MADEHFELRRINWTETFSFCHIFKSFRISMHLSKLALAFAAILLVFVTGWVMDLIWSTGSGYVRQNEIMEYACTPTSIFDGRQDNWEVNRAAAAAGVAREAARRGTLMDFLGRLPNGDLKNAVAEEIRKQDLKELDTSGVDARQEDGDWGKLLGMAQNSVNDTVKRAEGVLKEAGKAAENKIKEKPEKERDKAEEKLERDMVTAEQQLVLTTQVWLDRQAQQIRGTRIFESLLAYELSCLDSAVTAVRYGNITTGLPEYRQMMSNTGIGSAALGDNQALTGTPAVPAQQRGFVVSVLLAAQGVLWLFGEHWLYAVIFTFIVLCLIAFFGGAVNRMSAMHFAREEKVSVAQALRFSASKFFSFFTAPLIPLALIFAIGFFIFLDGLLGNFPVGDIIMAILLFLGIIGGLIIAFLTIGLVAGGPLMYPTIAVEGSDSFDAMSRSFSYIFTRPWRTVFYAFVALVYGVITYLFVRLFAYIALAATHCFLGWGVFAQGETLGVNADKLDVMWQAPTYDRLWGAFNWAAMGGCEKFGAFIIGIWVFIIAGLVYAYLLSYLSSATTVIYFLLRRKVDATDLDDVYVEEIPVEPTPAVAIEAPETAAPAEESGGDEEKPAE